MRFSVHHYTSAGDTIQDTNELRRFARWLHCAMRSSSVLNARPSFSPDAAIDGERCVSDETRPVLALWRSGWQFRSAPARATVAPRRG